MIFNGLIFVNFMANHVTPVHKRNDTATTVHVSSTTQDRLSLNVLPLAPFITKKYVIAVMAKPLNTAPYRFKFYSKFMVNAIRVTYCTIAPTVKAMTTDKKIPEMILMAEAKLMNSSRWSNPSWSISHREERGKQQRRLTSRDLRERWQRATPVLWTSSWTPCRNGTGPAIPRCPHASGRHPRSRSPRA